MDANRKMMNPLVLAALALCLAACASVPLPVDQLAAAEQSVRRADASRGDDPSALELKAARAKLAAARAAVAEREMLTATRLAVEAQLDADLAAARSEAAKAQFNVEAMQKSNEALRQQALRDSVNVAPIALPAPIPAAMPDDNVLPATTEPYQ